MLKCRHRKLQNAKKNENKEEPAQIEPGEMQKDEEHVNVDDNPHAEEIHVKVDLNEQRQEHQHVVVLEEGKEAVACDPVDEFEVKDSDSDESLGDKAGAASRQVSVEKQMEDEWQEHGHSKKSVEGRVSGQQLLKNCEVNLNVETNSGRRIVAEDEEDEQQVVDAEFGGKAVEELEDEEEEHNAYDDDDEESDPFYDEHWAVNKVTNYIGISEPHDLDAAYGENKNSKTPDVDKAILERFVMDPYSGNSIMDILRKQEAQRKSSSYHQ